MKNYELSFTLFEKAKKMEEVETVLAPTVKGIL